MSENGPNPYPAEEKALNAALAKAQGEFPAVIASKTVDTGSYKYSYIDLAGVLSAVRPVLAKNGLALVQRLEAPNGAEAVRTELRHADGGVIAASFPIGERPQSPQQLGSLLTYLRRYAIVAMLGIAAEEDDDGQSVAPATAVTEASPSRGPGAAAATGTGASIRPDTGTTETPAFKTPKLKDEAEFMEDLTSAQRRKIFAVKSKLTQAGLFTDDEFKAQLYMSFGVDSVSGLSKEQASDLIERLLKKEEELV